MVGGSVGVEIAAEGRLVAGRREGRRFGRVRRWRVKVFIFVERVWWGVWWGEE